MNKEIEVDSDRRIAVKHMAIGASYVVGAVVAFVALLIFLVPGRSEIQASVGNSNSPTVVYASPDCNITRVLDGQNYILVVRGACQAAGMVRR